ncbi:hypothetical protein C8F01DRAFT_1086043 [Mycena amicta]|nr:hypothetical protein C8F01DRAFT_1086043 [Mycena amicta]
MGQGDGRDLTSFIPTFTFRCLRYDHSERGCTVRRERVRGKRKIAKRHISRLTLPDAVENWACAELRQDYEVFTATLYLQDDFDETEFVHWLHPPPFDASTVPEDPDEDDYSNYWASCTVDGCLLRREQRGETQLKEQLSTLSKRKRDDHLRVEVKGLLEREWLAMRQTSTLYQPECFIYDFFNTNVLCARSSSPSPSAVLASYQRMDGNDPTFLTRFFNAPPTDYPMLRQLALSPDPELPVGDAHSILNSRHDEHLHASLLGRIKGLVKHGNQKYLVVILVAQNALQQDFEEFIRALCAIERKYQIGFSKRTESYVSADSSFESPGLVYVHLTAVTIMTLHACSLGEDWLEPLGSSVDVLAVGAVVFCVGYLLQIQSLELEMRNAVQIHDTHWIFRSSFIARFHLRSEEHHQSSPDVNIFLTSGVLPGRLAAESATPTLGAWRKSKAMAGRGRIQLMRKGGDRWKECDLPANETVYELEILRLNIQELDVHDAPWQIRERGMLEDRNVAAVRMRAEVENLGDRNVLVEVIVVVQAGVALTPPVVLIGGVMAGSDDRESMAFTGSSHRDEGGTANGAAEGAGRPNSPEGIDLGREDGQRFVWGAVEEGQDAVLDVTTDIEYRYGAVVRIAGLAE